MHLVRVGKQIVNLENMTDAERDESSGKVRVYLNAYSADSENTFTFDGNQAQAFWDYLIEQLEYTAAE